MPARYALHTCLPSVGLPARSVGSTRETDAVSMSSAQQLIVTAVAPRPPPSAVRRPPVSELGPLPPPGLAAGNDRFSQRLKR